MNNQKVILNLESNAQDNKSTATAEEQAVHRMNALNKSYDVNKSVTSTTFAQSLNVSNTTQYKVTSQDQKTIDHGTYIKSVDKNGKDTLNKISPKPIFLLEKVIAKGEHFIRASFLKRAEQYVEILIDIEGVLDPFNPIFEKLGIMKKNREKFAEILTNVFLYSNEIDEVESEEITPGFDKEITEFLTSETHALKDDVRPHLKFTKESEEAKHNKEIFIATANEFDLLRQMTIAATTGFITQISGLSNNPVFWFWDHGGNTGKSFFAEFVNAAFLHKNSVTMSNSTKVGIERLCYSSNDSFHFFDEIQHFADGIPQKIAQVVQQTAIGGGRAKAGKGAKTVEFNFKLSAIYLANKSASTLLSTTSQAEPVLSRIIEIEAQKTEKNIEQYTLDQERLTRISLLMSKETGFLTSELVEYIINNKEIIFETIIKTRSVLKNSVGKTELNGRNIDIVALFAVASSILNACFGIKEVTDNEIIEMSRAYKVSEEEAVEKHLDTLNQAYNLIFKNMEIKGYFASTESDLKDSCDENGKVIKTAKDKQAYRATEITSKNRQNSIIGRLKNSEESEFDVTSFDDFDYFALTKAGVRAVEKEGCDLSSLIAFAEKNDLLKTNNAKRRGLFKFKVGGGVGDTICFNLSEFKLFLKQSTKKIEEAI